MTQLIKLTAKERKRRDELVRKIKTSVEDVGKCLLEIHDSELYIETHPTFNEFIRDTFDKSKSWAYGLIQAENIKKRLSDVHNSGHESPILPSPSQAAELAKAPEVDQPDIWDEVVSEGKPTAAKVKAKVASKSGKDESSATDAAQEQSPGRRGASGSTEAPGDLAKKNKTLAHAHRDKLARAICDYHEVCPNRKERDRLVKLVQGVELW